MDRLTREFLMGAAGGSSFDTDIEFVASTSFLKRTVDTTTDTVTLSGLQADDVVFMSYSADGLSGTAITTQTPDLSNWTELLNDQEVDQNGNTRINVPSRAMWYKVSTGTSVSIDLPYTPLASVQEYSVILFAFRGLNTTNPAVGGKMRWNSFGDPVQEATLGPTYDTYNVAFHAHDDDYPVTLTPPTGYTAIGSQVGSTSNGDAHTQMISYAEAPAGSTLPERTWTANNSDGSVVYSFFLVAAGEDGAEPIITGSTDVQVLSGGTAVTTYSADETVTWSLEGTDASLFSISSGGVLTFNSASENGVYSLTVVATDNTNNKSSLDVTVTSYTVGTSGGGITLSNSLTGSTTVNTASTFTLTGLTVGDIVFFIATSDSGSSGDLEGHSTEIDTSWTRENIQNFTSSTPYTNVYWKEATSTSESVTISADGSSVEQYAVSMSGWSGVNSTDPVIQTSGRSQDFGTTVTTPAFTTIHPGVLLLIAGLDDDSSTVSTGPSGYTEIANVNCAKSTLGVFYKNTVGGSDEPSQTITFSSSDSNVAFTYNLNPS